ncbi:tol-pal system YbgF family protein [Kitasatospora sp. NPDC127116]|uniref:tetratricopeptide repeat protein n=1 Tax=Kitasatospora sp. NPDC127116 TaxID=3345367 RepID=UPI00362F1C3C
MSHKPSCAASTRASAMVNGWTIDMTVTAIVECCGVTHLRAHRLARGWTRACAVSELIALCDELALDRPSLDAEQLGAWERNTRMPRARTIDLLCRLYRTDAQGLGFAGGYRADTSSLVAAFTRPATPGFPVTGRATVPALSDGGDPLDVVAHTHRRAIERTLASTTLTTGELESLDGKLLTLRRDYVSDPPMMMLARLLATLEEVRQYSEERQPALVQVRLSEMIAVLSTLTADALMKLGRKEQARDWYGTAKSAADDSGNRELRTRVRVQAAMLPFYYGPLAEAAALAHEAVLLNRGRPSATGAFAAAAEARVRARQGDEDGARAAIAQARGLFDRSRQAAPEDDAWAFPYRRLQLYLSGAFTALGDTVQAGRAQEEALRLYPGHIGIDPALLRLEQAMCLVRQRSVSEACQLARDTYLAVPGNHRTQILGARAADIIKITPKEARPRAARELGELLALPAGGA